MNGNILKNPAIPPIIIGGTDNYRRYGRTLAAAEPSRSTGEGALPHGAARVLGLARAGGGARGARRGGRDLDAEGRVTRFVERPPEAEQPPGEVWVNSGLYVCDLAILDRIPEGQAVDFPRDLFPTLAEEGHLWAVPLSGYRCAVDSPDRLAEARSAVAEGRIRLP